jgi:16S rRNA (guanine527-N7)-methyltransferase
LGGRIAVGLGYTDLSLRIALCMTADPSERLGELLCAAGYGSLQDEQNKRFNDYLSLILRWNTRTNLTSIRDAEGILARHFVESIAAARALPASIASLLDFGSGAGFPGIPIAIIRPEIAVTLAESQGKKAAFLQEALRVTGISAKVHSGRAESLQAQFDCITLRAVDHMERALPAAVRLLRPTSWLAPMTTAGALPEIQGAAGPQFSWSSPLLLPGSDSRLLALGQRLNESQRHEL